MADRKLSDLLRHVRRTVQPPDGVVSDAELLGRFADRRDEAAFEALVWRHGPLVLGVCRRVLGRTQDSEDAFQAVFLILARKAGSVRRRGAVGPWLYRVAYRVALRARGRIARPGRFQHLPSDLAAPPSQDDAERHDLGRVLDEEVRRLPAKYREPVILRYLEGLSTAEAAGALGCPPGTVLSRLAWARRRLRSRLAARGVALSAAVAAVAASAGEAGAVPGRWVTATAGAALPFAAGGRAGVSSTQSSMLAEGVLRAMFMTKLRIGAVLAVGALAAGTGLLLPTLTAGKPDTPPAGEPSGVVTVSRPVKREVATFEDFTGRIDAAMTVDIRPRLTGMLVKVAFQPGSEVKCGELLFELDPRQYRAEVDKAEAELHRAEARFRRAEAELARAKQLHANRAIGQDDLDRLTADREEAVAGLRVAKAGRERSRLDLDATRITSPIDGRIGRPLLDAGNVAGLTTTLATIVSTNPVYAYFDVDERSFVRLRKQLQGAGVGQGIVTLLGLAGEEGFPHRGHLRFVDNRANPATGTIRARAVFPNEKGDLVPGLFARIRVMVGEPQQVLLVPEKVVMTAEGRKFVLVVGANNTVEWRAVTLGLEEGGMRVVREGLSADDRVIVGGVANVRPGSPVQPRETEPNK
jgi:RND family efflux transporter MFP subunit